MPYRIARRRRGAPRQAEGEELVYWLNEEPKKPKQRKQKQKISTLLRLLAESVDVQNAIGTTDHLRMYAAARPVYARIAELTAPYSYRDDFRLTHQGLPLSVQPWNSWTGAEYDDREAAKTIRKVIDAGRIGDIRRCVGCGKWIFAKKTDQSTCGESRCRARKMRKNLTEQEILERREKARDRYHYRKRKSTAKRKGGK